jgi:hypothetical protein
MVTLGIESGRERQDVGGAEFNAESASLTPFQRDGDEAFGHEQPSS